MLLDLGEGVVPTGRKPAFSSANQGRAQAVRVGMQFFKAVGFGVEIALAKDIVFVAANREDVFSAGRDLKAAGSLAEWAGDVVGGHIDLSDFTGLNTQWEHNIKGTITSIVPLFAGLALVA